MSVLIKGMKMPCCCDECRFLDEYGDYPCCIITDEQRGYNFKTREKHMDKCPLIAVPPHGRLIDADALANVFRGFIAMYDSCPFSQLSLPDKARRDELQAALAEVINAPTIIPAEEGE